MINSYLLAKNYTQKILKLLEKDFEALLGINKTIFTEFVWSRRKFRENEEQGPEYSLVEEDEILFIFTYLRYLYTLIYVNLFYL